MSDSAYQWRPFIDNPGTKKMLNDDDKLRIDPERLFGDEFRVAYIVGYYLGRSSGRKDGLKAFLARATELIDRLVL